MVELDVLITAGIGTVTTFVSGWVSWFFARKKYNAEVDNNLIVNMQKSLDFYQKLADDTSTRLEEVLHRNTELEKRDEKLEEEVRQLRNQMITIMGQICMDLTCKMRQKELFGNKK